MTFIMCVTAPLSNSKMFSSCQTVTLYSQSYLPLQPLITSNLHSLMKKTYIFNIGGITQYLLLCVWLISLNMMFSRLIYIVACIISFLGNNILYEYTTFLIHSSVDRYVGCFHIVPTVTVLQFIWYMSLSLCFQLFWEYNMEKNCSIVW